jgi:hypothetical protein
MHGNTLSLQGYRNKISLLSTGVLVQDFAFSTKQYIHCTSIVPCVTIEWIYQYLRLLCYRVEATLSTGETNIMWFILLFPISLLLAAALPTLLPPQKRFQNVDLLITQKKVDCRQIFVKYIKRISLWRDISDLNKLVIGATLEWVWAINVATDQNSWRNCDKSS